MLKTIFSDHFCLWWVGLGMPAYQPSTDSSGGIWVKFACKDGGRG